MGFQYRRRVQTGRGSWLNVSRSGISASKRKGRVTVNTRGGGSIRIMKGLSLRWGKRR